MRYIAMTVVAMVILTAIGLWAFVHWALPQIESPAVAGFVGFMIGAFSGIFGSILTAIVGIWQASRDAGERVKDRISEHALKLTQMDYELRQKSLELTRGVQHFLAPAKVYRTLYRALLELHTSGTWPKEVEEQGLLSIFPLGQATPPNKPMNSDK
jgi:hypothetical protein